MRESGAYRATGWRRLSAAGLWLLLSLAGGCLYDPLLDGTRCGPEGECPPGLHCVQEGRQAVCRQSIPDDAGDGGWTDGDAGDAGDGDGLPDGDVGPDGADDGGPDCTHPDRDGDGFDDPACGGDDCDDTVPGVHPGATEICDGQDNDCDSLIDADDDGLLLAMCEKQDGVCQGTLHQAADCVDGHWGDCPATYYEEASVAYEWIETRCDGLDNDCDGHVDTGLEAPPCELSSGVCAGSTRPCLGTIGFKPACEPVDYGPDYQASESRCDGLDNDCDGAVDGADPELPVSACELTLGVCEGSRHDHSLCGASGWLPCPEGLYGTFYQTIEQACDGLDNDCDGSVDEGCGCTGSEVRSCPLQAGVCLDSSEICQGGHWSGCDYGVDFDTPPEVRCDGLDNDCDTAVDEDLVPPACPLSLGVCQEVQPVCLGQAGWSECDYGANYEAVESLCDGLDNDCDGAADGADGDLVRSACELQLGVCLGVQRSAALCSASGWLACGPAEYGADYEAVETRCDGLDNDCDGGTDLGLSQACANLFMGRCAEGTATCSDGSWVGCPSPQNESGDGHCVDNVDNDCDGRTDGDDDECCGTTAGQTGGLLGVLWLPLVVFRRRRRR